MSAPVSADYRRDSRPLSLLFWAGVACAPVAALLLLVADTNGPLRVAAVLAIVAVVLIGLSIALRAGSGGADADQLRDEIEEMRRELRGEIIAAAQRGNQAHDAAQRAQEQVAALRRRLDGAAAAIAGEPAEPAGAGRARVPPVAAYDGRSRDADDVPSGWAGPPREDGEPAARRPQSGGRYDRPEPGGYGSARPTTPDTRMVPPAAGYAPRPVVRHTETVHVTTRHTVVDGPDPGAGPFAAGYAGHWSPPPDERPWAGAVPEPEGRSWSGAAAEPEGRSWAGYADPADRPRPETTTDDRWPAELARNDLDRAGHRAEPDRRAEPGWGDQPAGRGWIDEPGWADDPDRSGWADDSPDTDRWDDPPDADRSWAGAPAGRARAHPAEHGGGQWSQVRARDRWAEVRQDERGRELRVGERRASAHADPAGTTYRVEDRWASAWRGESRPETGEPWRGRQEPDRRPADDRGTYWR